jgi:hypothetical protein
VVVGPLIQVSDAAPTEYAPLLIQHDQLAKRIAFVLVPFLLNVAALTWAVQESLILQGAFSAFVADGTVEGVIGEKELNVRFSCLDGSRRSMDLYHHALPDGGGAGSLEPLCSLDLYQAHPASTHRHQFLMVAEGRNVNAGGVRCLVYSGSVRAGDLTPIYGQTNLPVCGHKR